MVALRFFLLLSLVLTFSCDRKKKTSSSSPTNATESYGEQSYRLQTILDSAKVKGAVVIYNAKRDTFYSNDFNWADTQRLPASTFKVPNSIIALETGVVENDSTLFEWGGEERYLKLWEQDLIFKDAFHFSCVPCYQEIARKIGVKRMNEYLAKFDYGDMMVDSTNKIGRAHV